MANLYCPNKSCGASVDNTDDFCGICGHSLATVVASRSVDGSPPAPMVVQMLPQSPSRPIIEADTQPRGPMGGATTNFIVTGLVVIIAFLGGMLMHLTSQKPTTQQASQSVVPPAPNSSAPTPVQSTQTTAVTVPPPPTGLSSASVPAQTLQPQETAQTDKTGSTTETTKPTTDTQTKDMPPTNSVGTEHGGEAQTTGGPQQDSETTGKRLRENGFIINVPAGWDIKTSTTEGVYQISKGDCYLRLDISQGEKENLLSYSTQRNAKWTGEPEYYCYALHNDTITTPSGKHGPCVIWQFRKRKANSLVCQNIVHYFNWNGRSYGILVRAPSLTATDETTSELLKMAIDFDLY